MKIHTHENDPQQLGNANPETRCPARVEDTNRVANEPPADLADSRLRNSRRRRRGGFTLIELLLVLVILGVLAAIVVPKFSGRTEQARRTAAVSQIATFGTALDAFEVDMGYYPQGNNGLQDLVNQPREGSGWKGPYLKDQIPLDPWGNAYVYECPGKHNVTGYDIMSMGLDGRAGTEDDIMSWQQQPK